MIPKDPGYSSNSWIKIEPREKSINRDPWHSGVELKILRKKVLKNEHWTERVALVTGATFVGVKVSGGSFGSHGKLRKVSVRY